MSAEFGNGGKVVQVVALKSGFLCCIPYQFGKRIRTHKTRHYSLRAAVRKAIKAGGYVTDIRSGQKILPVEIETP